jgi:hypothetical protein
MVRYVKLIQKSDVPIQREEATPKGFSLHRGGGAQHAATQTAMLASFSADWSENTGAGGGGGD